MTNDTGDGADGDRGLGKAADWLSAGLVLLTASLGALGGLTGGIARMFRNSSRAEIFLSLLLVLAGILAAVLSHLRGSKRWAAAWLAAGTLLFGAGAYWSMSLMVDSSRIQDRPTLSAQLAAGSDSSWTLKIQSSSSGLDANDQLQLLVYAQPKGGATTRNATPTPAGTGPGATPGPPDAGSVQPGPPSTTPPDTGPATTPTPAATTTRAPFLDGDRLLFTQAGPNIEGVASQDVDLPIPVDRGYETIIVTAVVGDFPRDCEGRTVNVRDNTELVVPPEVTDRQGVPLKRNGTLSCLTFAAPPVAVR